MILGVPFEFKRLDYFPEEYQRPEVIFRRADGYDFWLHLSGNMLGSTDVVRAEGEFREGKRYVITEVPS